MRILFIADGRSPIALNWLRYFRGSPHEVHLVSTFPVEAGLLDQLGLQSLHVIPVAFSSAKQGAGAGTAAEGGGLARRLKRLVWGAGLVGARMAVRQWLGPLTLPAAARRLGAVIAQVQPDLVHAMRIPYEGMLAALALDDSPGIPLLISVWGNDFTLHAASNPWMGALTRRTMRRASALHTDCAADQPRAQRWGFQAGQPSIVLPGNGGIDLSVFHPAEAANRACQVINPRGVRAYVRNDTFFQSIPLVLKEVPQARFLCLGMAGEALAERWLSELGTAAQVDLLPRLPRSQVAEVFQACAVAVSPTTHDGTPNTLLEAMACGCFPIVGDIPSLREWIEQGVNGFLVDPGDPAALAGAVIAALKDAELRRQAQAHNAGLIAERAEFYACMGRVEDFIRKLITQ
ncbi:MAG: glycosyltransferase family 4 protein [Anaerolineales bacterium]|jgi:glycosyltransferase involved in cell wall biosynthesis|nr:glycosyltransferase family 4 protein [Anaerolineales bacterium]